MAWAKRTSKPIPSIGSRTVSLEINDFSKGGNWFVSNDKMPLRDGESNFLRLPQNARITTLGEYDTRKGFDYHSDAAGLTQDQTLTSTTGAADESFNETTQLAQKWTCGTSGRLTKIEVNLKNAASATGTVIVEHWTDSSGSPGAMVARSSIAASDIGTSYAYMTARFASAPSVTATTAYWIVVYVQSVGTNSYSWSSTTSATTAMISTDSGSTWSSTSYALNFKQHYATDGGTKGLARLRKSDGTLVTLFAHSTSLYKVNDVTGALTAIKTGLSANATHYRFVLVNDIVYYVNGYDGLRKWDFTTESQVNSTNYTLICEHKGLLFLASKDDPNKVVFSNFADYETFTSTDFIYVPSPKTGDPTTAMMSLNGYLLLFTKDNKFILSGDDNATFSLEEAPDQNGTPTQETVTKDNNFVYYLSDSGVYKSNGAEANLISENNYQDILTLTNRDKAILCVTGGKLYMWYPSDGVAYNDSCWVWNLNMSGSGDIIESHDTNAYVSRAVHATHDDESLMVASSLIGQAYWQELTSNDYTNLGGDIDYLVQTHYMTFGSPAVLKEIRYWTPRFAAQSGSYVIECQYATDLRDNWTTQSSPNVQGSGTSWGSGALWGAFTWGTTSEVQSNLYVPGEYRRIALRYKHYATRQPQKFLGHTLEVQSRRLR